MSRDYNRCPFSYALFLGTAFMVAYSARKLSQPRPDEKDLPSCEVVFVLGGPGAGKGTQCQLIQDRVSGWAHLSAGDLLRAERKAGGELGDLINSKIASGALVPSSITVKCLQKGMMKQFHDNKISKFLVDGFPRSFENLSAWDEIMSTHSLKFVLEYECPEEVLVDRLVERGKSSGRVDDTIDVIRKRFQTHQKESKPIVAHYQKIGIKVHTIASDAPVEQVFSKTAALFS